jgi:putative transposase
MVVSDSGSELTSNAILTWADQTRIEWHYIAPGKPMQNPFIESFNGSLEGRALKRLLGISAAAICLGEDIRDGAGERRLGPVLDSSPRSQIDYAGGVG